MRRWDSKYAAPLILLALPSAGNLLAQASPASCIPHCTSLLELAGPSTAVTIRQMAEVLRPRISTAHDPVEQLRILNHYVFVEFGLRGDGDLNSQDALLPEAVLRRKSGYCLGLAAVYLALARQLGLPAGGVATPAHLFVRYDDGHQKINVEMLNAGMTFGDSFYERQYRIPANAIARGVFLRTLSEREVLGHIYANLGTVYSRVGDFTNSRILYEAALNECPRLPVAHYNLGNDLLSQQEYSKAVKSFTRALHLYPTDPWALNSRGLAYLKRGKTARARADFEAAIKSEPTFTSAKENLDSIEEERSENHR